MTNTNFRLADCNGAHDIYHEMEYGFIVPSIFFDFFAGFISLEFTHKMYQGIDISHPVYSVVFSNNALSTFISFAKFISLLIATNVESCIPNFIILAISTCVMSMNFVCWAVVASLRYYLLVIIKGQNNSYHEEVDMIKLKKKALFLKF